MQDSCGITSSIYLRWFGWWRVRARDLLLLRTRGPCHPPGVVTSTPCFACKVIDFKRLDPPSPPEACAVLSEACAVLAGIMQGRCGSEMSSSTGGHATSLCVQHCSFPVFLEATESIKQCCVFSCAARALRKFAWLPCIEGVTVRLEGGGA